MAVPEVLNPSHTVGVPKSDMRRMRLPWLVRFQYLHEGMYYFVAVFWLLGYLSLFRKVNRDRSAAGLSFQTLFALMVVEISNILLLVVAQLPTPAGMSLSMWLTDGITALVSATTFFFIVNNFYSSYQATHDSFGYNIFHSVFKTSNNYSKKFWLVLYLLALLLAIPLIALRRSHFNLIINAWQCINDCLLAIALVPQLYMFYNKRPRVVGSLLGQFVIFLLLARFFSLTYWLVYPIFNTRKPRGRGVHIVTEIFNVLILADFFYYYLVARIQGHKSISLPF